MTVIIYNWYSYMNKIISEVRMKMAICNQLKGTTDSQALQSAQATRTILSTCGEVSSCFLIKEFT